MKVKSVDECIARAPKEAQGKLLELRGIINTIAPDATEGISYNMPYYKLRGPFIGFASFKDHVSLFGSVSEEEKKVLRGYETSKGTIIFPLGKPLPKLAIKRIVRARAKQNSETVVVKRSTVAESNIGVDAYIAKCPKNIQGKLRQIRAAIKEAAPGATETTSYFEMPGYSYPGYDYNGMFAWFGLQKSHIGLYLRPPTIQNHAKELVDYTTTKAVVRLPLGEKIPVPLVKKLVRESVRIMKAKSK